MRTMTAAAALMLLSIAGAAQAHHGWSSYDAGKVIEVTTELKDLRWANPHGSATIDYRGKPWHVVLAPVARMENRGLTEAMIGPGKKVKLVGYPRSDGTPEMRIERVIVGDKTVELR